MVTLAPPHPPADDRDNRYRRLIQTGIALSAERDHKRLIEMILLEAKEMSRAEGGTVYLLTEDGNDLCFVIMHNDVLGIAMGGATGNDIPFAPISLRDDTSARSSAWFNSSTLARPMAKSARLRRTSCR